MPRYDYFCADNGQTVEVIHHVEQVLETWGEVCYAAQIPMGNTDFVASVRKVLSVPNISVPMGNSKLKEVGFTKLVKRDNGVYENVTRTGDEKRYMKAGQADSMPHLHKKIGD
ncbi:MAG: putative nucleic acid-binding Zn ribbon protein [Gammaproteobacteria bacterium]|jgi:predicted nucleic acid-binding Zn ribbon protein